MTPLKDFSIFQLIVLVFWSPSLLSQQSFLLSESTHPHTSTTEYIIWKSAVYLMKQLGCWGFTGVLLCSRSLVGFWQEKYLVGFRKTCRFGFESPLYFCSFCYKCTYVTSVTFALTYEKLFQHIRKFKEHQSLDLFTVCEHSFLCEAHQTCKVTLKVTYRKTRSPLLSLCWWNPSQMLDECIRLYRNWM